MLERKCYETKVGGTREDCRDMEQAVLAASNQEGTEG